MQERSAGNEHKRIGEDVVWFHELSGDDVALVGGKGANLGQRRFRGYGSQGDRGGRATCTFANAL